MPISAKHSEGCNGMRGKEKEKGKKKKKEKKTGQQIIQKPNFIDYPVNHITDLNCKTFNGIIKRKKIQKKGVNCSSL